MERFRSKSTKDGRRMQHLEKDWYTDVGDHQEAAPPSLRELRSYSTSYVSSPQNREAAAPSPKMKRSTSSAKWSLIKDPELQRKKRVASYKAYGMERKMKGSFGKSFKWIKDTCHTVFGGGWR